MPESQQLVLMVLLFFAGAGALFFYLVPYYRGGFTSSTGDWVSHHWAQRMRLDFMRHDNGTKYSERFMASPGKTFFSARRVMQSYEQTFFAEGTIQNRRVWLYRLTGSPFAGSGVGTVRTRPAPSSSFTVSGISPFGEQGVRSERVFYGWCLEVGTKKIPQTLMLTRRFMEGKDVYDTESRDFEKNYEISRTNDSMMLQLLDPAMMDQVLQSRCGAIEISDASVALYYTLPRIPFDTLDSMLDHGWKIAEQVDRNFPLDVHEKGKKPV
ncbi:MAG: hypothetical protein A2898_02295 [Candidatus Kerfeldbacteria bacterium RIFCSPLOWO2_01_FULL_48_11]|uniref:DUF3137 domain-containing protein n=1 Tax=Candidatus Kerfeldbacteria bacterium RIFCSPLOWO2_01_FULL_48_11 TaxID=1798543 RepID=A0A1G2B366_9BACT|nr:MAG: hypothetical protein UY34_C0015G0023 [Parcubacteria group bacterium GW2011_GWA2_48_9]KKW16390.1 MAG: hypothetical protein UY52_C0005G0025 [Parcubacteria group bacterium GW2011_GWC2_49_9]OGY83089.1 MAG: hypothetical protein A2898_02295 [Candidatus Kerfeldbacteria bacterium RIFCSPLOWO2_01_FULL_48_11]HCM68117.1 hypothetical protein [Candidatus Kerfeldbacteria bacterium]